MTKALVVGQVTHDRYGKDIVPGGCAFFGAHTFFELGSDVSLVTSVGKDFKCKNDLAGLKVTQITGDKTTTFVNTYPADGPRIQWVESTSPVIATAETSVDIAAVVSPNFDITFIAPVFGEMDLKDWPGKIKSKIVGVGLQGFLKQAGKPHPIIKNRYAVVPCPFTVEPDLFKKVNVVFLSDEDIKVFGTKDLLDNLRQNVPIVVMTQGKKGTIVFNGNNEINADVFNTKALDPTGAGDTFAAAFLFALARGDSLAKAAKLGTAAASIVVEDYGGASLNRVGEAFKRQSKIQIY